MQNNKKGFTLSEVLVCLMIVGIIMALSVNSIKIVKESYVSLAYYAFKNLQGMVTELFSGSSPAGSVFYFSNPDNPNDYYSLTRQCINTNGTIIQVLKSDNETKNNWNTQNCRERKAGGGGNYFCHGLAQISNTSGKIDCSNLSTVGSHTNENGHEEPYISALTDTPNFITTNGQRFYVSNWVAPDGNVSSEFGYRLVGIDLNATSKPNIAANTDGTSSLPPDIVTFMVLDNGEVFPLGVAADNYVLNDNIYLYINARLKGYYFDDISNAPNRETTAIPSECQYVDDGENNTCNYAVIPVTQKIKYGSKADGSREHVVFSYREAYCGAATDINQLAYKKYCTGFSTHENCPGGTQSGTPFDECRIDTVKPAFRFGFD